MTALAVRPQAKRKPLPPILTRPCLLLNADYRPLSTEPPSIGTVRWAIEEIHNERCDLVEAWPEPVRTAHAEYPAPKVIVLRDWVDRYREPRQTRRNIFLRDRMCCQYCGERFASHELTYDHVIPRRYGGKTVWENVVAACIPCNAAKGDSLPNWSAPVKQARKGYFRPLKEPRQPSAAELYRAGLDIMPDEHRRTFADYLGGFEQTARDAAYWNVTIDP